MTKTEATEAALAVARADFRSDDVTLVAIAVLGDEWLAQIAGPVAKNATWRHESIFTPRAPHGYRSLAGTPAQVEKKLAANLAERAADAAIIGRLTALVHNGDASQLVPATTLEVDAVAYVYAMGQWRRGLVTKIGRTRVEVAYTTASSQGRVFRKAAAGVLVAALAAVTA
jgi:hypothetical protein